MLSVVFARSGDSLVFTTLLRLSLSVSDRNTSGD
jgi:hypothetical protein